MAALPVLAVASLPLGAARRFRPVRVLWRYFRSLDVMAALPEAVRSLADGGPRGRDFLFSSYFRLGGAQSSAGICPSARGLRPSPLAAMSLQWTAVATFLYAEVFAVLLLCVPFISAPRWQKIFRSRLVRLVVTYGNTFFVVLIVILILLLLDAVREIQKYDDVTEKVNLQNNPGAVEHFHMKLFRAQRNLYLAGFALLLSFLLRRLVTLISQQATLLASNQAFKKQAESASDAAKRYMEDNDQLKKELKQAGVDVREQPAEGPGAAGQNEVLKEELKQLKEELALSKRAVEKAESEALAMRKQARGADQGVRPAAGGTRQTADAAGGTQGQEGGVTAPPLPPAALAVAFCRRSLSWTTPPAPPWVESTVFGAGQAPLPSPSARRRGGCYAYPITGLCPFQAGVSSPCASVSPLCDLLFPPLLSWVTPRFPHWSKGLWGAVILPSPSSCTPSL
ncbi:unnamed protein product [Caretta caretta]